MKKLFVSLFLLVAIASFGGILAPVAAHADTALTPAQAAVLQQSLEAMKAKLLDLQAQAAAQTATQAGPVVTVSGTATLSASDMASLTNALSLLASALTSLQTSLAQNPQLAAGREQAVLATLKGVGTVLATIGTTLGGTTGGTESVAIATPTPVVQPPVAGGTQVTIQSAAPLVSAGTLPSAEGSLANPANASPEIAQVGSTWSFKNLNWPLVIVIVLVVAAVALWLFWPNGEEKTKRKPVVTMVAPKPMPQQPTVPQFPTPQSPMMQSSTLPQQQPQQRKPA